MGEERRREDVPRNDRGSLGSVRNEGIGSKISANITVDSSFPNRLSFHHYQKFNSFDFEFDRIIYPTESNVRVSEEIDLF